MLAANPLHNAEMPTDVNQDAVVTPADALAIINQLNRQARGIELDEREGRPIRMTDVNNDGRASAIDALMVINRLNRRGLEVPGTDGLDDKRRDSQDPNTDDAREEPDASHSTDVVLGWNQVFSELLVLNESNQNPGYASRAMAMLNIAIYDSVAISRGELDVAFVDYALATLPTSSLRTEVVVSQAAFTVLSSLYPDQQDVIDVAYHHSLRNAERNAETAASLELGALIGQRIIAERSNDGWDAEGTYTFHDEAGYFQADPLNPDVPVWGPAWGNVAPFAISASADFQAEPPPALTSQQYADSFNEVLAFGAVDSEIRSADQTEAGLFWAYDRTGMGTPIALFSSILESIAVQEGNTIEENAALFAQAAVAMADAGVVAWQTKFSEEFWRPVTAIHQADTDGNPMTFADPEWTALGAPDGSDSIVGFTPQFPTYISGHATFGGALFGAIREFYGRDDIAFEVTSNELALILENAELEAAYGLDLDDATRSFSSLSEAMAENGRSRVYLGIHFDFDDLQGQAVGQAIAEAVASEFQVVRSAQSPGPRDGGRTDPPPLPSNGTQHEGAENAHRLLAAMPRDSQVDLFESIELIHADRVAESDLEALARDPVRSSPTGPRPEPLGSEQGEVTSELIDDLVVDAMRARDLA